MKKFSIILGAIILVLFVTLVIWGVYCDNTIAITNYCVNNTKNDAKLKFVVITDLHNKEYGEKNADLAELANAPKMTKDAALAVYKYYHPQDENKTE